MKKRLLSLLLVFALMCSLVTTAFAGAAGAAAITLKFSLEVLPEDNANVIKNSDYDITAPAGTVITIKYYIANTSNSKANISTNQDEILYDHNFFDFVDGSNKILEGDYKDYFSTAHNIDSEGGGFAHLVKFNSSSDIGIKKNVTAAIGEFKLKIKDTSTGTSVIKNTELDASSIDGSVIEYFKCVGQDLTVHVGSGDGPAEIAVTAVTVDETAAMYVGEDKTLTATVTPANATDKTVTWSSDNESVATVDAATGKVTAVAEGTANITATSGNGKSDSCAVTVSRKSPTASPTNMPKAEVKYGDTVSDSVITGAMIDGTTVIPGAFAWKNVTSYGDATVTPKSLDAVFTPSAEMIGKYKPVDVDVSVTVAKADQEPSVTATKTLYVGGAAFDLRGLVSDAVGAVTFTVDSGDAATLSGGYMLTPDAVKTGTVVLSVKAAGNGNYNEYNATGAVTVTVSSKSDAAVTISGNSDKTYGDSNFTLTASAQNKQLTGGTWTWSVGSSGTFEIVSGQGTDTVTVKILKANTAGAVISAEYEDDTYLGSDEVTVKVAKADPSYTAPTGLTAIYGQTLADVTLPDGWSWMDDTVSVGDASATARDFSAKFTPDDTDNYNVLENLQVGVTVGKASRTATAPVISAHTDTTVTAQTVIGQKYMIKKSSDAAPAAASDGWGTTAEFTGLEPNTAYKVYTYLPGNENYENTPVVSAAQTTEKTTIGGSVSVSNTAPKYGDTLGAVVTAVLPEAARSGLTYQWYRGEEAIAGATESTYKVTSADIGSTVKVKVTASGSYKGELTSEPTDAAAKAAAPILPDQNVSQKYTVITEQSKSVAGIMPTDAGTLSYTAGAAEKTGTVTVIGWSVSDAGTVSFTLSGGAVGDTVTLPVTVGSTNYENSTVKVIVTLTDKLTPSVSGTVTASVTYGDAVSNDDLVLDGVAVKDGDTPVPGSWSWKNTVTSYGDATAEGATKTPVAVFTPDDLTTYKEVEVNVSVSVAAKELTVSGIRAVDREYAAGNTAVELITADAGLIGAVAGDDVALDTAGASGSMQDDKTGEKKAVTVSGLALTGEKAGNYTLTPPADVTVKIYRTENAVVPVTGDQVTDQKVDVKISGTNAELIITDTDLSKLGTVMDPEVDTGIVTIDLTDEGLNGAEIRSVEIPAEAVAAIAAAAADTVGNDVTGLTVKMTDGTAKFDREALTEIKDQSGTDGIKLVVVYDEDKQTLNETQKAALEDRRSSGTDLQQTVYEVHLETLTGERICAQEDGGLGDGKATVIVRHRLPANAKNIKVFYLKADGTVEDIIFTTEGDEVVFEIAHFSEYMITYTESRRSSGGAATYAITGGATENGRLTIGSKSASAVQTVTVKVTPDEGYALNTLTVKDAGGNAVEVKKVNETTYTFKMPASEVSVSATFAKLGVCPQDETCVYAKFPDADTRAWYHDGVHFCVERGYMVGVAPDRFAPDGTLSRAMIVTMLWRMEGSPVADYAMSFKDVASGQWYTEAIRWAQSTGVVLGYNDDAFGPGDDVTREQLAAILHRFAGYKGIDVSARATLDGFADVNRISGWALENIRWANAVGIVNGRTAATIVPTGDTTRAEAACMVQRFCENILKK